MALFKGDVLIAGTNPSGGGGAGGGHVIQDSTGEEFEQRPALQFIGADVVDDDINEATQVITPSFREIQGDTPDTNLVCLDGIPIGGIIPYGASIDTLSQDWLPCLGQAVSRTLYHELFAKYGTIYGSGDGSTTFNLPNYGGRVPVGLNANDTDFDTLGETLGEKTHTLTVDEMPSHAHYTSNYNGGGKTQNNPTTNANVHGDPNYWNFYNPGLSNYVGGSQSHNNIQPSIVANYIVKAKTSSHTITTSNVMTVRNESDTNTYSTNYINNLNSYSTNETIIGAWIDDKPIYKKTIQVTLPSNTDGWYNIYSNAVINCDSLIRMYGWFKSGTQFFVIPMGEGDYFVNLRLTGSNLECRRNGWSAADAYVTFEYTKTTD